MKHWPNFNVYQWLWWSKCNVCHWFPSCWFYVLFVTLLFFFQLLCWRKVLQINLIECESSLWATETRVSQHPHKPQSLHTAAGFSSSLTGSVMKTRPETQKAFFFFSKPQKKKKKVHILTDCTAGCLTRAHSCPCSKVSQDSFSSRLHPSCRDGRWKGRLSER